MGSTFPEGEAVAKRYLHQDRSCVLAAFYRQFYEQGTSRLVVEEGDYARAARELGLNLPHHRMRAALENLSFSTNQLHRRLVRDPDKWAEESYKLKEECFVAV